MLDVSWPSRRQRYANLTEDIGSLTYADRRIDAELARLMVATEVVEREGEFELADKSPLLPFSSSERKATSCGFDVCMTSPFQWGPICRRLVEEAVELFE